VPVTGIVLGVPFTHRPAFVLPIKCEAPELATPRGLRRSIATLRRSVDRAQKKAADADENSPTVQPSSIHSRMDATKSLRRSMPGASSRDSEDRAVLIPNDEPAPLGRLGERVEESSPADHPGNDNAGRLPQSMQVPAANTVWQWSRPCMLRFPPS
jgi:hypothetical protein